MLTREEVDECFAQPSASGFGKSRYDIAEMIESAVLEKLEAQEPFGYFKADAFCWTDCAETDDGAKPLYEHPLPADDVVRDAERLDWLMNSGRMVICDREGCYTYTHTSGRYGPVAKTQRGAIDAAMKEMK